MPTERGTYGPYNTEGLRFRGEVAVTVFLEATPPADTHVLDWCPALAVQSAVTKALREYPGVHAGTVQVFCEERNHGVVEQPAGQMGLGLPQT